MVHGAFGACQGLVKLRQTLTNPDQGCDYKPETDWSECSATCGGGTQTRNLHSRFCFDKVETQPCNTQDCACVLGDWSDWSDCMLLPGKACANFKYRSRPILEEASPCDKYRQISFDCPLLECMKDRQIVMSTSNLMCFGGCSAREISQYLTPEQQNDIF
eukprot:TRINITY_DN2557_c0_g1_i1.p1 TRINITY_DN2557_c0_g1~~TRINITY_DN2557_c0_g1_i1.p1  ORF type:complete len:160 (-),score=5.59 TRINITY_DN2557_c0_g1_i1:58-537(-)